MAGDMARLRATSKGRVRTLASGVEATESFNDVVIFRRTAAGWKICCYCPTLRRSGHAAVKTMSDERYTVILGDRRYAIHRKWAKLPAGESFGFPVRPDGRRRGRAHVAQRGTDRPVLVFDRDGRLTGTWGEGRRWPSRTTSTPRPTARSWWPTATPIRCCASTATGKLLQALGKRHWPSLDAPFNHPTAAAQAPDGEIYVADGYGNSSVHRFAAGRHA